jgi:hypothetical protein
MKKGRFYGSKKRYFYLEDFYLKYGDKEGKARKCIDLSQGNNGGSTEVTLSDNKKKVKVIKVHCVDPDTGKFTLIRLKAENREERDEWFECLKRAIAPFAKK